MGQDTGKFNDFKLNRQLLEAVEEAGWQAPTPIQQKAIPLINSGHDLIGIAQTGTGKTAAFVLPLLMKVKYAQGQHPRALILAPTRELVLQIEDHLQQLARHTDLRHVSLYGGLGPQKQIEAVQQGVDILISTPGRFMDLYAREAIHTRLIKTLVLDEADRMMDMGFMPQIRQILEVIPVKRQNLLFSATFPPKVEHLAEEFLEWPERVEVAPQATAAQTVSQYLYQVPNIKTKTELLAHLLANQEELNRVMVFVRSKSTAENIFRFLDRKFRGQVRVIHANKGQNSRINAVEAFKEGQVRVLVSTDVTARGIDISQVSHVINFEVPLLYEDYVHRIGRTGRAFLEGQAITFANEAEMLHVHEIEALIRQPIEPLPWPELVTVSPTPKQELIDIMREIDTYKRKKDPDFKGAFHEKKRATTGRTGGKNSGGKNNATRSGAKRSGNSYKASSSRGSKGKKGGGGRGGGRRK